MSSQTFVVLIALDAYAGFGPLRGATADALHWASFARHRLGVDGANLRLCTSPALDGAGAAAAGHPLPGATFSGATFADVAAALRQLAADLQAAHVAGAKATGLIVFSGHGAHLRPPTQAPDATDFLGDRLAWVLQDTTLVGAELHDALVINQLDALLANTLANGEGLRRYVTVVTDCCYHNVAATAVSADPLGQELAAQAEIGMRVMLGAQIGSPAYTANLGGQWRSAYSFSLLTLLSQWRTQDVDGVRVVLAGYGDLTFRAREQLAVLGFADQVPALAGSSRALSLPFNSPSLFNGHAVPAPDAARERKELSGGIGELGIYQISVGNVVVAVCLWYHAKVVDGTTLSPVTASDQPNVSIDKKSNVWWTLSNAASPPPGRITVQYGSAGVTAQSTFTWSISNIPFPSQLTQQTAADADAPAWQTPAANATGDAWRGPFGPEGNVWIALEWATYTKQGNTLYYLKAVKFATAATGAPPQLVITDSPASTWRTTATPTWPQP